MDSVQGSNILSALCIHISWLKLLYQADGWQEKKKQKQGPDECIILPISFIIDLTFFPPQRVDQVFRGFLGSLFWKTNFWALIYDYVYVTAMYKSEKESLIQVVFVSSQIRIAFRLRAHVARWQMEFSFSLCWRCQSSTAFMSCTQLQYDCIWFHWEFHIYRVELYHNVKSKRLESSVGPIWNSLQEGFEFLGVCAKVFIITWFCVVCTINMDLEDNITRKLWFSGKCLLAREFYLLSTHRFVMLPAVLCYHYFQPAVWVHSGMTLSRERGKQTAARNPNFFPAATALQNLCFCLSCPGLSATWFT